MKFYYHFRDIYALLDDWIVSKVEKYFHQIDKNQDWQEYLKTFLYMPVGNDAAPKLMPDPKQREAVYRRIRHLHINANIRDCTLLEARDFCQKFQLAPHGTTIAHPEAEASMFIRNILNRLSCFKEEEGLLGTEIYEKGLFATFLVLFLRACVEQDRSHQLRQKKQLVLDDVFRYISHHLTEEISLSRFGRCISSVGLEAIIIFSGHLKKNVR